MDLRKLTVQPVIADDGEGTALQLIYWPKGKGHPDGGVYALTPLRWEEFCACSPRDAVHRLAVALENALYTLIYLHDEPEKAAKLGMFDPSDPVDIAAEVARILRLREGDPT